MAEGLQVGGLASGLDTNAIITGLIQIENQRVVREETKKSDYELKLSTFNDLKTKITDLNTQAVGMNKTTALNVFKTSTSDDTVANISGGENATPGNFDVRVDALASSIKVASKSFTKAQATAGLGFDGSFNISTSAAALKADPTVTQVAVSLDASDTLKDIAAKINRATGTGATASVVQLGTDDYRLMISAVDEGTKGFTLEPVALDEAESIFSDGLDLVNEATAIAGDKTIRSTFDLKLATGGPASATTKFGALFNGLGTGHALTQNDTITISGVNGAGGAVGPYNFTIGDPATDSLQSLLTSMQTQFANSTVTMNSSGEIVMNDTANGAGAMSFTMAFIPANDVDGSGSTISLGASEAKTSFKSVISEGKKAFFMMNDIPFSSQTNRNDTTIDGTIFELKKVSTSNVKLTLDYDKAGIQKKVQDFLDSYNQVIKYLDEKSKIEVKKKDDKGSSGLSLNVKSNIIKGPFAGDSNILGLKSQLQSLMTSKIAELEDQGLSKYSSLASLGITSESKTGFLMINETTFSTAIDTDFEGIKRLFQTSGYSDNAAHTFGTYSKDTKTGVYHVVPGPGVTGQIDTDKGTGISYATASISGETIWTGTGDVMSSDSGDSMGLALKARSDSGPGTMTFVRGVGGQIKDFYEKITNYVDGFMTTTGKNFQDRINDQDVQIAKLEKRVESVKLRLTNTFAKLEQSISKLQSQSAAFGGQISSLRR